MKRLISILLCITLLLPVCAFSSFAKTSYKVRLANTSFVYDGKAKTPEVTVTYGSKTLEKGTDYKVKYPSKRTDVGTYTVTVTMKGKYEGTKTASFRITPPRAKLKSVVGAPQSLVVKWTKKNSQVTGYIIEYSTTASFTSSSELTVRGASSSSATISFLRASTKYYVRIKTYTKVSSKTYYSDWSAVMSAKTLKADPSASIPAASETGTNYYVTKTGSCYHRSKSCAGSNAVITNASYAKAHYRPCSKCV